MLKPLLVLAPLAVPAAPPPDAQTVNVIRAAGFGHGVGLSQFGAYGYARNGRDYRQILSHYYRGAELSRVAPTETSVLVRRGYSAASFRGAGRVGDKRARPNVTYTARPGGPGVELYRGRKKVGRFTAPLRISHRGAPVQLMGKADTGITDGAYRGSLILHRARGGLMVVNRLPLDDYVRGVVPGEMPASWHPEALKSQAVAARSYALASPPRSDLYDNLPDTRSQVYVGLSGERTESNAAVRATARQVLTYRGKPIVAYFFSTSGGRTENAENSFVDSGPRPYLVSVPDPYDRISPRHRSELRMSGREMARRLRGHYRGRLVGVQVLKRGVSPRIVRARIVGTQGSETIDGGRLRTLLGLPDTWADFHKVVSWGARRRIAGFFAPRGAGRITIERRAGGRWRRAGKGVESFTGDFSVRVRPGVYRARSGRVTGPAVKVR